MRRLLLVWAAVLGLSSGAAAESAISGRVFDSSDAPVAGAAAKLVAYRSAARKLLDGSRGAEAPSSGEAKTGRDGAFRLPAGRLAGEVSVLLAFPGLPFVEIDGPFDREGSDEDLEISIPAAQRISGRITDESGAPVAGARVRAQSPLDSPQDAVAFDETRTGRDGAFLVSAAPRCRVTLRIVAAGFSPLALADARSGRRIVLRRGGSVEGAITDSSGKPVAGAIVVAGEAAAQTNESGRYRIEALPEGLASLKATVDLLGVGPVTFAQGRAS